MRGESDSYLRGAAKTARDILPPMAGKGHSYSHQHLFYYDKGHYLWHLRLVSPRPPASARAGEGLGRLSDRGCHGRHFRDRKSTRLNSSHANISYAVFCLKKKKIQD